MSTFGDGYGNWNAIAVSKNSPQNCMIMLSGKEKN